jgi:hypothetical protein
LRVVQEAGEVFYSRVSSCYVVADLYKVMNEDMRPGLREIYTRLVIDELPMVRRAAALVFTQVRFACFVTSTLSLCPRRDALSVVVSVCVLVQVAANAEPEVFVDEYLQVRHLHPQPPALSPHLSNNVPPTPNHTKQQTNNR